jgi:hypothetical protein
MAEAVPARGQTPPPAPTPDFVLSEDHLAQLETVIAEHTAGFTVEELEQLRAALMQRIWKRRSDWDRSALLDEMIVVSNSFIQQVNEAKAAAHD